MKKVLFIAFVIASTTIIAQTPVFKMEQIAIASGNVKQMADFYSNVFGIQFNKSEAYGVTTYNGYMGDVKLYLYPSTGSPNMVNQNRHQFDFTVTNLSGTITNAVKFGGKIKGEVSFTDKQKSAMIMDPDGNTITFKQLLGGPAVGKL